MEVCQGTTGTTGATRIPLRISAGAFSDAGNGTATLMGFATECSVGASTKCAIGHCRTASNDRGSLVFLCSDSTSYNTEVSMSDERMRITSTGNVGIGTISPNQLFHLHRDATSADVRMILTDNTSTASGSRGFHIIKGSANDAYLFNYENTAMVFGTNTTERMRITSTGNVGIGTNPTYKCQIHCGEGGDVPTEGFALQMSGNYYLFNIYPYVVAGASVGWRFRVKSVFGGDNTAIQISNTGSVYFPMGSSSASDSRIKKDIEDINDETALNKLLLIQPTTYNYIDVERNKGFGKVYGFIAQQIREVIPEAITIIVKEIIPNIYKSCLINNKREVYHKIPLDTPVDTSIKIDDALYKIKEIYEDYFVIDNDIDVDEAFVFGYSVDDFHTLNKDYIFTLNVCATQELHRRIETQSVLLKSQDDRIKDLETKVAMLMGNSNAT